jgi:deoxyribose-phosphate aldolase
MVFLAKKDLNHWIKFIKMLLEYCCYNKNLIEDVDSELMNIFKAVGMGFLGIAVPFHILRQISQDLMVIPDISIACPIDYPLGAGDKKVRQHESIVALKSGANSLDVTMNPYLFKKNSKGAIYKDINPIATICSEHGAELRVIINYELYDTQDAIEVCGILADVGVDAIIPSAGFSNDDIFDNIMFCKILEEDLGIPSICTGRMWLDKHYKAALNSQISAIRAYCLSNIMHLGVDSW